MKMKENFRVKRWNESKCFPSFGPRVKFLLLKGKFSCYVCDDGSCLIVVVVVAVICLLLMDEVEENIFAEGFSSLGV